MRWPAFAEAYADQNERDYDALRDAVASGRVAAETVSDVGVRAARSEALSGVVPRHRGARAARLSPRSRGGCLGTPITPAMVFVAVGLLVGPEVLDGIDLESTSATVRTLAEATLALVLFCDASRIDLGQLRREVGLPVRLLGIGLPLTIALGAARGGGDLRRS